MTITIPPDELEHAIETALARFAADQARLSGDWLAVSEEKAAALLGLDKPSQLRDARLRGEISASQLCGRRIRYTRADLLSYLASRRYSVAAGMRGQS